MIPTSPGLGLQSEEDYLYAGIWKIHNIKAYTNYW